MKTRTTSAPELIAAAQEAGWHHNELGREILAELSRRQETAAKPRQLIWALAAALLVCLALLSILYAHNAQLTVTATEGAKAAAVADARAKEATAAVDERIQKATAAAEREAATQLARAIAADKQVEIITAALNGQQAAVVKQFTEQLNSAEKEIARLRDEVAKWKAAAVPQPVKP